MREQSPVCWLAGLDAWLLTRHEDVRLSCSDPRLTADPRAYDRYEAPADPRAARWISEMPFRSTTLDGASLGRRLVSSALTPRAVARLTACTHDVVEHFATPLRQRRDVVDLMGEFSIPVSATAIGRILGVPPKDEDEVRFRELALQATATIRPFLSEGKRRRTEQAAAEMGEYVLALVKERSAAPRDDLISDLLRETGGDASVSADDVTRVIAGLVAAGTGTTGVAFGRAMRSLLKHPDQLSLLRSDRSLIPNAVEELLRYDSGLIVMPRYALEDFTLHGQLLRKGQLILLCLMGANRDPRVFAEPETVDIRRETRDALSFGHGTHYCVGANIARMELRLMIEAALDFLPPWARLCEEKIRWSKKGLMSQIKTLPVDFAPRERASMTDRRPTWSPTPRG